MTPTAPAPELQPLPVGFEVRLRDDVVSVDSGRVLIGGTPLRAARLSLRARVLLEGNRVTVGSPDTARLARRLLDADLAVPVVDGVEVSAADLTVVIPVQDRVEQLERCLAGIVPLPVIVVDDASMEPAAVARVARRFGADLVSLRSNVGPAGARNAGLARVTTPLVAFVDSDVVADSAALLDLARHCLDTHVALVGPRVEGQVRSRNPQWFERYDAVAGSLDLGRVGGQVRPAGTVGWLPSACLVGRVSLLRRGFDDTMRVGEDVDLVWRLVDAGLDVRYDPSVVAHHDVRSTFGQWLGRKFVYGTGSADLSIRHGDQIAPAVLTLPAAVAAAALLQRRWWSLPLAGLVVATTSRSLRARLPVADNSTGVAVRLSLRATGWAVRQESGLLLRHWWPAAALAALFSRRVRRSILTAIVVDVCVVGREPLGVGHVTAFVGRRLDDLAYGAGLWWGAFRRRTVRCLVPRRPARSQPAVRSAPPR